MYIREISIDKFPVVVFSDSHCNLSNVRKLKELYPDCPLISLGDFTFLFAKDGDKFNDFSIQYFIDNNIPVLEGNHEAFLAASENEDKFVTQRALGKTPKFNLSKDHLQFLENLPRGFKLNFPDGNNIYCFHNLPRDLWSFPDSINEEEFKNNYVFDSRTVCVLQGHLHKNLVNDFKPKRVCIGKLCNSSHHDNEDQGGNYALVTKSGVEFKKI